MSYLKLFFSAFLFAAIIVPVFPETLFLKDGTVIEGKVVENGENELLFLDKNKKLLRIPQKNVSMLLASKKFKYGDTADSSQNENLNNNMIFDVKPGILVPIGKFAEMGDTGYGIESALTTEHLFIDKFEIGADAAFYFLEGRDLSKEKSQRFERFFVIPVFFAFGYKIGIKDNFALIPEISAGGVYFNVKYSDHSTGSEDSSNINLQIVEPAFRAGVSARCNFTDSFSASLSSEYVVVLEKKDTINFIVINAGLGYNF